MGFSAGMVSRTSVSPIARAQKLASSADSWFDSKQAGRADVADLLLNLCTAHENPHNAAGFVGDVGSNALQTSAVLAILGKKCVDRGKDRQLVLWAGKQLGFIHVHAFLLKVR